MRPVRATVDTNVAASAAHRGGNPGEVMQMWEDGGLVLCVSRPIVAEYRHILVQHNQRAFLADLERRVHSRVHCEMAEHTPSLQVVSDPTDNMFVECAVSLRAEFIVSGDKALLRLGRYEGVVILNPADFLKTIQSRRA